ncbi:nucleoprotein TPR [Ictalurus punctatus]|uniref:Nucleoprotein TPR n=1 Tax=Ictalurus punctatus TaxID=7998 RepID=A0A2D0SCM5_ICTPU|nr:nucleoprotein TPR [Ictalurus punctatus]
MVAALQGALKGTELSKAVQGNVEKHLAEQQKQQHSDLDKRYMESQDLSLIKDCQKLQEDFTSFDEELTALREINKGRESSYAKLESEQKELSNLKEELEADKRDLVRTLERKSREVEGQSRKRGHCLFMESPAVL